VPGIVPIARNFTPFAIQAQVAQYTFTGGEPGGVYRWFAALMQPGTLTPVGPIGQYPFVVCASSSRSEVAQSAWG
jgi:hypothetical protein